MKLALAQINPTVGDFSGNLRRVVEYGREAQRQGAELVVFPELCVCGYPPADLLEKSAFLRRAWDAVEEIAEALRDGPAVLCGTARAVGAASGAAAGGAGAEQPAREGKQARNVAVLLAGGRVVFEQQKMLLPFYDVFDEQRYFEPARQQRLTVLDGQPLAITVCEDAWNDKGFWPRRMYTVDPVDELMRQWGTLPDPMGRGPRVVLNLSASPYWCGKGGLRREMLAALARRHNAYAVMVNQVGGNDSILFDGSSLVVDPRGEVVVQAASFREDLVVVEVGAPAGQDQVGGQTEVAGQKETRGLRGENGDAAAARVAASYGCGPDETGQMWDALVMGTRDYVRKCGFAKAVVGLSGGIDSALVAALAVEALGAENVLGVGMPSEFSSTRSIDDARTLAQNLGIRFELLAIREVFEQYGRTLEPLFAGTAFGLAEENLQSRIRGALLMAISNKFGALVLTTGNKSEMATGYCTLYGDMVGALAVIGDVYKTRVYALSRYANRVRELIPRSTLEKPPSAELRPGQKDTDSLPPYEVLDPILEAYVERYCSAEQILAERKKAGDDVELELIRQVVKLVERNEYKRQQAAPVLKVTQKSFGSGRRFPIAVRTQV